MGNIKEIELRSYLEAIEALEYRLSVLEDTKPYEVPDIKEQVMGLPTRKDDTVFDMKRKSIERAINSFTSLIDRVKIGVTTIIGEGEVNSIK